ncbi:MAG: type IV pilus twitching motility protein PilT [Cyanosarcina radialis HA8281-LM2]|jgi:twitching motility protein PilT|nr:type IV pilus twitching motility protein PilT [Cyanosarcina radialis HA8281-LM2]
MSQPPQTLRTVPPSAPNVGEANGKPTNIISSAPTIVANPVAPPPPPRPNVAAPPPPGVLAGQRANAAPPASRPPAARKTNRGPELSPGQPTLAQLIREAHEQGFSDVHLGVAEKPRFRDRGEISTTDYPITDKDTFMCWLREILSDEEIRRFQETLDFDGATQYDFARVRINIFDSLRGPAMVLRLIPLKILTMEQLRLPNVFKDVCHYHKGLVLVTGPTGSGKSTTLAAMIDYMNKEMPKHIITIEDPVEFVHQSRRALIKQREVGIHTMKFDNALKAALREDPDVILIGEMRDKETVNTALKAAQTGHLVMGTLHTNSAVKTIERILQLYNGEEQDAIRISIAESLVGVIAQGLCRTTDGKRAAYHDILINTETVKDYIQKGRTDEIVALMAENEFDGMITMNKSLFNLYQDGLITEEVALEMAPVRNEMAMMLRGRI